MANGPILECPYPRINRVARTAPDVRGGSPLRDQRILGVLPQRARRGADLPELSLLPDRHRLFQQWVR